MEFIWEVIPGSTSEGWGMGGREGEEANRGHNDHPCACRGSLPTGDCRKITPGVPPEGRETVSHWMKSDPKDVDSTPLLFFLYLFIYLLIIYLFGCSRS